MSENPRLQTRRYAREQAIAEWVAESQAKGANVLVSTKPVYDTKSISATVDATDIANGVVYAVFAAGQEMAFFSTEIGKAAPLGADPAHNYSDADTNLTDARQTPGGNSEQVIEAVGLRSRGVQAAYAATAGHTASTNASVLAAIRGTRKLVDPSCLVKPVELESPFMLEEAIFQGLLPECTLELTFDNSDRTEKLCTLDQIPGGGGGSYLRSNGEPSAKNLLSFPEGYRWKRPGSTDSANMTALVRLRNDVVVPLTPTVGLVGDAAVAPATIHVLFRLSFHGINMRFQNSN